MAHVDWIGYTLQVPSLTDFPNAALWTQHVCTLVPDYFGFTPHLIGTARRPGAMVGADIGKHSYVWFIKSGYMLIEHTGRGCEQLRANDDMLRLLETTADNVSRLDIAVDYDTDQQPADVVTQRDSARQTARSSMVSATGATEYIGSRRSDRYMRIYRYNPPHPRAQFLRLEYVLKKQYAQTAARAIADGITVDSIATGQRQHYGLYADFILNQEQSGHAIKVEWEARSASKTLQWLYGPVAASMKKLVESGDLDLDEFLQFLAR